MADDAAQPEAVATELTNNATDEAPAEMEITEDSTEMPD
jgi:hypothetical protein